MRRSNSSRGIALVTVLLVTALLLTLLAVMVNLGTTELRRTLEDVRSAQAQAGADAGAGWVRALLYQNNGNLAATLAALARSDSTYRYTIDDGASISVHVSMQIPNPAPHDDHQDVALQENPQVAEAPLQLTSTATVLAAGTPVARRTTTVLLRVFHHASPYSEVVGVVDNAGPVGVDSPGDPAGQAAAANTTELRIHAYTQSAPATPRPADDFQSEQWWDGNATQSGPLP